MKPGVFAAADYGADVGTNLIDGHNTGRRKGVFLVQVPTSAPT